MLHPEVSRPTEVNRIELTADDLRQLEVGWTAQWRRRPTSEEMHRLVEGSVREEILYREALGLGLDRGDTIVKRRLAQKMEFLAGFAFNAGVELGQLAFIAAVLIALRLARRIPVPRALSLQAKPIATYAIGTMAAFWFVDRVAAFVQ